MPVGLSASTIGRLKEAWQDEHAQRQKRDLSAKRYVYVWADGIYLEARLEDEKQCIRVLIGATSEGKKELVGFTDGARESAHDWRSLLLDLKRRCLEGSPELAIADGALGFWKAAGEIWPKTREQRCWVHKTANVLAKLPKAQQPKAKRALQEIWMAETKIAAVAAFDAFIESYELKYAKAAQCLAKDRDVLLVFYDFPAEHWKHLRTTNPIESTFATGASPHHSPKRLPLQQDRACHGLQAGRSGATRLAPPRRWQPVAKSNPRCEIC
jgi:putative transposase